MITTDQDLLVEPWIIVLMAPARSPRNHSVLISSKPTAGFVCSLKFTIAADMAAIPRKKAWHMSTTHWNCFKDMQFVQMCRVVGRFSGEVPLAKNKQFEAV